MHTASLRAASLAAFFVLILSIPRASAQSSSDLSVHATSDSLIVSVGSDTIVIPRDALELLSSPEGYSQDALSLHVALLHGILTEESPPSDDEPPTEDDTPPEQTLPLLSLSTSTTLHTVDARRSPGDEGHEWENADLNTPAGVTAVQLLPDSGTRYNPEDGAQLAWDVDVIDQGSYYIYTYGAGINGGKSVFAGTQDQVQPVNFGRSGKLVWRREGPFSLQGGPGQIIVRGRHDGAYFASAVVSADPDLTDNDLEIALTATNSGTRALDQTSSAASRTAGSSSVPEEFAVHAIYPNPTQGEAVARFDLPEAAEVNVEVFDALGRRVSEHRVAFSAGFGHTVSVGTASLTSGVYIVRVVARLSSGERAKSQRFTVVQ